MKSPSRCLIAVALLFAAAAPTDAIAETGPPVLLQMIRDDAVHDELGLSDEQVNQILEHLPSVDGPWWRTRNMQQPKRDQVIEAISNELSERLADVLDQSQQQRLFQLQCQSLGTRVVVRDDIASRLQLNPDQIQSFRKTFAATDQQSESISKKVQAGNMKSDVASRKLEHAKSKERFAVVNQLTSDQKSQISQLFGQPFDFAKVRRTYPLAPELTNEGSTWVQGGPINLNELRGKVVAVHFYAFECYNCENNLPHYKAWHDDYADQGLVVIGIQTPELASERKLENVARAAKLSRIEYPVILDKERSNWLTWSNTMWPTVYLIDKKGFIRRWWQGELNWKGTPGEKQMRRTIEQLLAEES